MSRRDPSSSCMKETISQSPCVTDIQKSPPSTTAEIDHQNSHLLEDLKWAIFVASNELGGVTRVLEPQPGKLGNEDLKSLLNVENRLENLRKSKAPTSPEEEQDTKVSEITPYRDQSSSVNQEAPRQMVIQKLKATMRKLDFTAEERRNQLEREEGMWLFCTIFREGYEFEKDTLIQLWMAMNFVKNDPYKKLIRDSYFCSLVTWGFIQHMATCFPEGNSKYTVDGVKMIANIDTTKKHLYRRLNKSDLLKCEAHEEVQHLSLVGDDADQTITDHIKKFKNLKALLFNYKAPKTIIKIPHEVFLSLRHLQVLDFSGICIAELPNSIVLAKELRYLDLSFSLIELLPETIDCLTKLQTLKLKGCTRLLRLPRSIVKLSALRHLDINTLAQLSFLPRGMGKLTSLETLSAFLIDKDKGRGVNELRNLNNLRGSLCISKLERVLSGKEAEEAVLSDKVFLERLEFRWSEPRLKSRKEQERDFEVLEHLRLPSSLEDLELSCYAGYKFPDWISDPKELHVLNSITLFKCEHITHLPPFGALPCLKALHLIQLKRVKRITAAVRGEYTVGAFPALRRLTIVGLSHLESWNGVQAGDFPFLSDLSIQNCPKLEVIPPISCLKSLKQLEISHCTRLSSLTDEELTSSLNLLTLNDCPSMRKRYMKRNGGYWSKIKHVQNVWIDDEEIKFNDMETKGLPQTA